MSFSLQFIDNNKKRVRIRAGALAEEFTVDIDATASSIEECWRQELVKLLGRKRKIALCVISRSVTVSRAWIIYRVDETAFIQDKIFPHGFDSMTSRIPKRETTTKEGHQISEWSVGISAIRTFLGTPLTIRPSPLTRTRRGLHRDVYRTK